MSGWDPKETLDSVGLGKIEQKRSARVADVIRNEISTLLVGKVKDPKLINVTISRVDLTDDLNHAKIFFTVFGDKKDRQDAENGLRRAKGFIRSYLAKTINLRFTPELRFIYDETAEKVEEMEKLFQEIADERGAEQDDVSNDDT